MPKAKAIKIAEIRPIDDEQPSEETELLSFLDNLGPSGVSECSLYRITTTGKQKFVTAGPPTQFTEQDVQNRYGGGDYLVRAKLGGKWFRSKTFSVEGPAASAHPYEGVSELERIKTDLEAQRLRMQEQHAQMESDRREREQRNHELQLAMIQGRGESSHSQISEMITGLKALHDLSGTQEQSLTTLERSLGIIARITEIRAGVGGGGGEGGWLDFLKPVGVELGKTFLPRVLPFLGAQAATPPAGPAPAAPAPAPAPDVPAMTPGLPEVRMDSNETPAPEPAPTSRAEPTGDAEQDFRIMKAQALAYVIPLARMNRSPEFYSELAVEQVETTSNPVIARFLTEIQSAESFEAWFRGLQAIDSTIITSERWFAVFFQSVRDVLSSKEEETPET